MAEYEQSEHVKLIAQSAESWEKILAEEEKSEDKLPEAVRAIYQGFAAILRVVHPAVAEQDLRLQVFEGALGLIDDKQGVEDEAAAIDAAVGGLNEQN